VFVLRCDIGRVVKENGRWIVDVKSIDGKTRFIGGKIIVDCEYGEMFDGFVFDT
jgi:hypothetical protein